MATFKRPLDRAFKRDLFTTTEVGLTHPENDSYIKLGDNSCIEIMLGDGMGIIIDSSTRSISLHADTVKFFTKETDGLRWNRFSFNPRSTKYTEPTFIETDISDMFSLFNGVDVILNKGES